jgi:hypothetical protein
MKVGISVSKIFDSISDGTYEALISELEKIINSGYEISVYNSSHNDECFSSVDKLKLYIDEVRGLKP